MSETCNTQTDNAKDTDVEMLMYNLIEYSSKYSKTSETLGRHYKDKPHAAVVHSE